MPGNLAGLHGLLDLVAGRDTGGTLGGDLVGLGGVGRAGLVGRGDCRLRRLDGAGKARGYHAEAGEKRQHGGECCAGVISVVRCVLDRASRDEGYPGGAVWLVHFLAAGLLARHHHIIE